MKKARAYCFPLLVGSYGFKVIVEPEPCYWMCNKKVCEKKKEKLALKLIKHLKGSVFCNWYEEEE